MAALIIAANAQAQTCVVDDNLWLQPRTGLAIRNNANIMPCISAILAGDTMHIVHANNDDANIHADELRQWLIALALPATRIILDKTNTTESIRLETRHE
ncbi:MAG: hypothetical protein ABL868_02965 [Sulfuriferula sp.]